MKTDTETGRRGDTVSLRVAVSPSPRVRLHPSSLTWSLLKKIFERLSGIRRRA